MTLSEIKGILEKLLFPKRYLSDQTAICLEALADKTERTGLLPDHQNLADGARIHDILNFSRDVIGKKVAENTREAYRKTSLAPLMTYGLVVRHQLSTNDPNTYYRLCPGLAIVFSEKDIRQREKLINQLKLTPTKPKGRTRKVSLTSDIPVRIGENQIFALSPGEHNLLERAIAETFASAFLQAASVVYLGDTAPRIGYQNRVLMRKLNLPIDTAASLPDVIILSESECRLVIAEAVTSSGPINAIRFEQLERFTKGPQKLGYKISYVTAFPSRHVFRRFVEEIVWGSSVWISSEPNNIIHFEAI
jgi:type II restriction enzyme